MERLTVYKTDKGRYSVRPIEWEGIWDKNGRIQENGLKHTAIFSEKEDAEFFAKSKNAEEQGKLLILPCKPGDTAYVISNYSNCRKSDCEIIKAVVTTVRLKSDGKTVCFSCRGKWKNKNPYIGNFTSNSVGKTVFMTEQEANDALEGMKE